MGFVVLEILQGGICEVACLQNDLYEVALCGVAILLGLLEVFALF